MSFPRRFWKNFAPDITSNIGRINLLALRWTRKKTILLNNLAKLWKIEKSAFLPPTFVPERIHGPLTPSWEKYFFFFFSPTKKGLVYRPLKSPDGRLTERAPFAGWSGFLHWWCWKRVNVECIDFFLFCPSPLISEEHESLCVASWGEKKGAECALLDSSITASEHSRLNTNVTKGHGVRKVWPGLFYFWPFSINRYFAYYC